MFDSQTNCASDSDSSFLYLFF